MLGCRLHRYTCSRNIISVRVFVSGVGDVKKATSKIKDALIKISQLFWDYFQSTHSSRPSLFFPHSLEDPSCSSTPPLPLTLPVMSVCCGVGSSVPVRRLSSVWGGGAMIHVRLITTRPQHSSLFCQTSHYRVWQLLTG